MLNGRGIRYSLEQRVGDPAWALARLADEVDARYIVVGTREAGIRGSIREFFNGSVAVHLAHRQHRPVIVVPLAPVPGSGKSAVGGPAGIVAPGARTSPLALTSCSSSSGGVGGHSRAVPAVVGHPRCGRHPGGNLRHQRRRAPSSRLAAQALALRGPDTGQQAHGCGSSLGTGILGGFTTYSAFAVDADGLIVADRPGASILYALATILVGAAASVAGIALGAWLGRMRAARRGAHPPEPAP